MTAVTHHARKPVLRVQLLGAVGVWRGPEEVVLGPPQRRSLFAELALAGGQPVARDELIARLWRESPPARAVNVIQTHIKHLRQALEPDRPNRARSTLLPAVGLGYALRVDPSVVDALRFRRLVAAARAARRARDHDGLWRSAAEAVRLWRPPLADLPRDGRPTVVALEAEWRLVLAWYAEAAIALGRPEDALPTFEQHARVYPLDEQLQVRLLRLYQAAGRRAAALEAYAEIRQRLTVDLGVGPGVELAAAFTELLRADAAPAARPPAAAGSSGEAADDRSSQVARRLAFMRTWDVLCRVLPVAPARVLDVGGAAERYSGPLAAVGYAVHVIDSDPGALVLAAGMPGVSVDIDDAGALTFPDDSFDAVLLLGLMYRLTERVERVRAWREAARVVRPGGVVVAATVNRFAIALDGLARVGFATLKCGHNSHHCAGRSRSCATPSTYPLRPEELAREVVESGLRLDGLVAVEGPAWTFGGLDEILADAGRARRLLGVLREMEEEPSLLGASGHVLTLARAPLRALVAPPARA